MSTVLLALAVGIFIGIVISLVLLLCVLLIPFDTTKDYPTKEEWKAGKHAR